MSALGVQMAPHLRVAKQTTIAVCDFIGPGQRLTSLGTKLADDFALALAQSNADFSVEKPDEIRPRMQKAGYSVDALLDARTTLAMTRNLKAQVAVLGTISREVDGLKVLATAINLTNYKAIDSLDVRILVTPEMMTLMQAYSEPITDDVPMSGTKGYSFPRCYQCPTAAYTSDAAEFGGTVALMAIVTADGRAQVVKVIQESRAGLAEKVVEAVRQWRFTPAKGPDGKPATVRQIIEETYHRAP